MSIEIADVDGDGSVARAAEKPPDQAAEKARVETGFGWEIGERRVAQAGRQQICREGHRGKNIGPEPRHVVAAQPAQGGYAANQEGGCGRHAHCSLSLERSSRPTFSEGRMSLEKERRRYRGLRAPAVVCWRRGSGRETVHCSGSDITGDTHGGSRLAELQTPRASRTRLRLSRLGLGLFRCFGRAVARHCGERQVEDGSKKAG